MQWKQAHGYTHMKCNQSSWACSPYLCASLVQEFWFFSILQCYSLFIHVHVQLLLFCLNLSQSSHIFIQSLPFVINFHIRYASLDTKGCSRDRWLTLESYIFYGHHLYSSLDTMCRILWPWYQLVVGLLSLCPSMGHSLDDLQLF